MLGCAGFGCGAVRKDFLLATKKWHLYSNRTEDCPPVNGAERDWASVTLLTCALSVCQLTSHSNDAKVFFDDVYSVIVLMRKPHRGWSFQLPQNISSEKLARGALFFLRYPTNKTALRLWKVLFLFFFRSLRKILAGNTCQHICLPTITK